MHPNDTLNGKLVNSEWERDDQKHLRHKVGYWRMVEERMIRSQIIADGGDPNNQYEIARRIQENHKNDLSLKEYQRLNSIQRSPTPTQHFIRFTEEELKHLLDYFADSNHPISQKIHEKVLKEYNHEKD